MPALKDAIRKLRRILVDYSRKRRNDSEDPGDPKVRVPLKPKPLRGHGAVALAEPDEGSRV
jgi:hypothetical protein